MQTAVIQGIFFTKIENKNAIICNIGNIIACFLKYTTNIEFIKKKNSTDVE
jgi:hypothetical protein